RLQQAKCALARAPTGRLMLSARRVAKEALRRIAFPPFSTPTVLSRVMLKTVRVVANGTVPSF
ncbi:MAG: hypothetical protein NZ577_04365, partial [Vicinamibacterales bacterium]|nr:hypothetical protein [Vicinamibacterales bacterium]